MHLWQRAHVRQHRARLSGNTVDLPCAGPHPATENHSCLDNRLPAADDMIVQCHLDYCNLHASTNG